MKSLSPVQHNPAPQLLAHVVSETQEWLERVVIGLNLCPFAKSVHTKGQIHYAVTAATTMPHLREDLRQELMDLAGVSARTRDTTLLIAPQYLQDFMDFNDFLEDADNLLEDLGLNGILQIASFHPQYQFAGTDISDVTNCTNRSPYPTLHLLREESIDRAVQAFPEASAIYERNMQTLEKLGMHGWLALNEGITKTWRNTPLPRGEA